MICPGLLVQNTERQILQRSISNDDESAGHPSLERAEQEAAQPPQRLPQSIRFVPARAQRSSEALVEAADARLNLGTRGQFVDGEALPGHAPDKAASGSQPVL